MMNVALSLLVITTAVVVVVLIAGAFVIDGLLRTIRIMARNTVPAAPSGFPTVPRPAASRPDVPVSRAQLAGALGVSERTVRRSEREWGLQKADSHGRGTVYTVASANQAIRTLRGDAA